LKSFLRAERGVPRIAAVKNEVTGVISALVGPMVLVVEAPAHVFPQH